jgi:hypothetical protein
MIARLIVSGNVLALNPVQFIARVIGPTGSALVQADITSISVSIYDTADGSLVATHSLTVSAVIFNTLQNDARWTPDNTGYNFLWICSPADLPGGNKTYRVQFTFTPASGSAFILPFEVKTTKIYS